jgi:hypothetical protein
MTAGSPSHEPPAELSRGPVGPNGEAGCRDAPLRTRALIASAILLGAGLAACGGSGAGARQRAVPDATPPGADTPSLCVQVSNISSLVVDRRDAIPANHFSFSFPSAVRVAERASARAVATAVCHLPAVPSGAINCPADFGITYSLTFSRLHGASLRPVVIEATGCQTVSGAGGTRWLLTTIGFWTTLGRAMRLPQPSEATFRGTGPPGSLSRSSPST